MGPHTRRLVPAALPVRRAGPHARRDASGPQAGPPGDRELDLELDALEWFAGRGGVGVLLCDSMGDAVVLHGDLHHENILWSADRGWVAIDPSGVVGEREYETGALLRNPMPVLLERPDPGHLLERRADQLAEALALDGARVRAWAWVQAKLAAAWSVEGGEDSGYWLAVADLLEPLTRRSR